MSSVRATSVHIHGADGIPIDLLVNGKSVFTGESDQEIDPPVTINAGDKITIRIPDDWSAPGGVLAGGLRYITGS